MKIVILVLSMLISLSAFTQPQKRARTDKQALAFFIENIKHFTIENKNQMGFAERTITMIFASALLEANTVAASCHYRGKSFFEECEIIVDLNPVEGGDPESTSSLALKFNIAKNKMVNSSVELLF